MANEYKLNYTASDINEKLGKINEKFDKSGGTISGDVYINGDISMPNSLLEVGNIESNNGIQCNATISTSADLKFSDGTNNGVSAHYNGTISDSSNNVIARKLEFYSSDNNKPVRLTNIYKPEDSNDAVNKSYVDEQVANKFDKSGGTLTGNLNGRHISGTLLQSTQTSNLNATAGKIAVFDGSGWIYYRTLAELKSDLGIPTIQTGVVSANFSTGMNGTTTSVTFSTAFNKKPAVICQQVFNDKNCNIFASNVSTTGFTIGIPQMTSSGSRDIMWVAIGS